MADTVSGLTLQPSSSFELTLEDDDEAGIVLSRTSLTVREEGSRTWTVKLNSEPTDPVTVTLAAEGTDAQDLTIEPDQLTFATDNWNRTQTVTVSAAEDADGDDDTATIGHTATGGGYDSVEADLPVRVDDIDQTSRSVQLSLAPDLVEENGGSVTITVTAALDGAARSAETAVAVQATGGTAQAGTDFTALGTVTVAIPAGETSGTQTFSFSPVDDSIDEGLSETVVLGGTFQGLTVRTATLTLADDDGRGIELPTGTVTLSEEGTATYAVSLATQPTGTVTVRVTVSGDRDITVAPTSMTFTGSNWDTAQMVTVTAARDDDAVTDTAELRHTASGADYGGVRALPLQVAVTDTSVRGVPISVATLEFREGGRARYTVVLETKPTGTVTVRPSLAAGSDSDVTVSPSALSFTTSSWRTPKTVTVRARQDIDATADTATITHAVTGADYGDAGVTAAMVSVTVNDDDVQSTAIVLQLSTTTVPESTSQTQITVTAELNGSAMANAAVVTLDLEGVSGGAEEVVDFAAITPVTLTIRAGQTRATARVTVRPVRDDIDEGDGETLRLVADTASGLTLQPSSSFELTLEDDDEARIVLSRTSLTVREVDSQTWTVKLNSEPTGPVTVALAAEGAGAQVLTITPTQLAFTAADWNAAQTVTVEAAADQDSDDETATIAHTASGGGYGSQAAGLPVTLLDSTGGPSVTRTVISPVPPKSADPEGYLGKERFLARADEAVHGRGATLTFTLTFNHEVTVTLDPQTGTRPELVLDIFGRERRARYTGGSGTRDLTFAWTVKRGDYDPDGLRVRRLALNGAKIRDGDGRDTEPATFRQQHFATHRVRGGFFAMSLDVRGPAREGEPITVRVVRDGGFDESADAVVQVTDTSKSSLDTFVVRFHPEGTRADLDPASGSNRMTPAADGQADGNRTLTFRLVHTDRGAGLDGLVTWYDAKEPVEVTMPVADAGLAVNPPKLSVGPAVAAEQAGQNLLFEVKLSGAAAVEVTVDYATADGTATAGADYVETHGTLTFAPSETVKTVEVEVLPDDHDEGVETVWLELTNPQGAAIERGRNFGQIHNSGPIPKAWTARFGRTVVAQVLDAVEGRLRAAPATGVEVTLAGERVEGQAEPDEAADAAREAARLEAARLADWLKGEIGPEAAARRRVRVVTGRELLTGSSFTVTGDTAGGTRFSLWGRGALTGFDGREGNLVLDGEVATAMLGAEWTRRLGSPLRGGDRSRSGAGSWTAGLIVSHSTGEGGWSGRGDGAEDGLAPGSSSGTGSGSWRWTSGKVEATLTGVFPWVRYALSERLEAWGTAGYGAGDLTVTPNKPGTDEDGAAIRPDLDLWMAAAGLRGTILDGGSDGVTLTGKTDAMVVQTSSGRGEGADGGNLEPDRAAVTRLRLGVEARRPVALGGGVALTPSLEFGVRHDGGDAETGFGLDLGGGLTLSAPARGLQAELRGRGLLSHESKGFRDRSFSGSLSWRQKPSSDRGAALTLTQTFGGSSSDGADALLARTTMDGLAVDSGGDNLKSRRLELKFGYGFSAFDDRFTWTPEVGAAFSDTGRDMSLGWRLVRGPGSRSAAGGGAPDGGSFEISFEGRRRESANDNARAEHEVGLKLTVRF